MRTMLMMENLYFRATVLLVVSTTFFISCGSKNETATPTQQDITESVYASGVVKAVGQYEVFAPSNGIITETYVQAGDSLLPGTPLFNIDNTISSLSAENARLAMEILEEKASPESGTLLEVESRMKLAGEKMSNDSLLFERQKVLWDQKIGSKVELEQRELAFKSAKTEYAAVRLQYMQLKSELEKLYRQSKNNFRITQKQEIDFTVRSTIKGTVYNIFKEPGEFVSIQTPVAVIGETGRFEIELQVDEFDIVKVKTGQKVFLSMDSYRGEVFEARISRIEPYMNERSRTFTVWAEFIKQPELLYPNFSLEANILIAEKKNALTIPAAFLVDKNKVLTAPQETTQVEVGIANLQWVEITGGLDKNREIYLPAR